MRDLWRLLSLLVREALGYQPFLAFTVPATWRRAAPAIFLLMSNCAAGPWLYYESTAFRTEAVERDQRRSLVTQLQEKLGTRPVRQMQDGRWRTLQPAGPGLKALSLPEARALYALMGENRFGAEVDILIRVQGSRPQAVQVRVDPQGAVDVWSSGMTVAQVEVPQGFFASHGIGPLQEEGSRWQALEVQAVALAISKLAPEEGALLQGIPIIRAPSAEDTKEGGLYLQKNCEGSIYVYDRAFLDRDVQFIGSPKAPLPAAVMTMLHELGHALNNHQSRRAFCQYEQQLAQRNALVPKLNLAVVRYNDLVARFNAGAQNAETRAEIARLQGELDHLRSTLDRLSKENLALAELAARLLVRGPVLTAYEDALNGAPAPTKYGESHIKESFAESFALFRADPEALKRVLPQVHAWFEAGGHVRTSQGSPDR